MQESAPKIGRPERARAEIQQAAVEFLWSYPFRDMSVNRLMACTSLSRAAFYYHFSDIHDLMKALLAALEAELMAGVSPWLSADGDPVALFYQSLSAEVDLCYRHGPMLKAVSDAAGSDASLERAWYGFLDSFDVAVSDRIAADQALGLIDDFDPKPVATALNHADAALYIRCFGQKPRVKKSVVLDALFRSWISTLYGKQWVDGRKSTLIRQQPGR